jgi:hypothetical protein
MRKPIPITPQVISNLRYDPDSPSGLRWRERRNSQIRKDLQAGCLQKSTGYWVISSGGRLYRAQRLVWAIHHGDPGVLVVDHVNGDRADNRIENLQAITEAQNAARVQGRGTHFCKENRRWQAAIGIQNKQHHLGYFDTEEEARAAYVKAKREVTEGLQVDI